MLMKNMLKKRKKNIDILHKPKPKPRKKYKFDRLRFLPKTSSINLNYYDINTLVINAKEGILTINKKNNKEK